MNKRRANTLAATFVLVVGSAALAGGSLNGDLVIYMDAGGGSGVIQNARAKAAPTEAQEVVVIASTTPVGVTTKAQGVQTARTSCLQNFTEAQLLENGEQIAHYCHRQIASSKLREQQIQQKLKALGVEVD